MGQSVHAVKIWVGSSPSGLLLTQEVISGQRVRTSSARRRFNGGGRGGGEEIVQKPVRGVLEVKIEKTVTSTVCVRLRQERIFWGFTPFVRTKQKGVGRGFAAAHVACLQEEVATFATVAACWVVDGDEGVADGQGVDGQAVLQVDSAQDVDPVAY
jgi:hypothetical protein